jgi:L-2-hydroxyglutarate oxidase
VGAYDLVVVGGGIVGLATAWRYLERWPDDRVLLVEKEAAWATHQSGHNSGVIHAGLYYVPGSAKARLCTAGNRSVVEYAASRGVPYVRCGKLVVATSRDQLGRLDLLYQRGVANGVPVRRIGPAEVRDLEPNVACVAALQVSSTGVIDFGEVSRALAADLQEQGADLRLATTVTGLDVTPDGVRVSTDAEVIGAQRLVNCAGLQSDRICRIAGAVPPAQIVPFRGEYYTLTDRSAPLVRGLVYPVPDPAFPFLGVHFTRGIDGVVHVGPNAVLATAREGYRRRDFIMGDVSEIVRYAGFRRVARRYLRSGLMEMWRSLWKPAFVAEARRLVPDLEAADLVAAGSGVRAQAVTPDGMLVDDFLVVDQGPCVHLLNAPSPAATAALEIGREIRAMLRR